MQGLQLFLKENYYYNETKRTHMRPFFAGKDLRIVLSIYLHAL
jgi:hypothetical protein